MGTTDDIEALGRRVLQQSRSSPLRERMEAYVDENGGAANLEAVRPSAGSGRPVSEIVTEDRDERF